MVATHRRASLGEERDILGHVFSCVCDRRWAVIREWWLPTGGHLLEKSVTSWVTYSPVYVTVGGQ